MAMHRTSLQRGSWGLDTGSSLVDLHKLKSMHGTHSFGKTIYQHHAHNRQLLGRLQLLMSQCWQR